MFTGPAGSLETAFFAATVVFEAGLAGGTTLEAGGLGTALAGCADAGFTEETGTCFPALILTPETEGLATLFATVSDFGFAVVCGFVCVEDTALGTDLSA